MGPSTLFAYDNFSARVCAGGAGPPSVNLGPVMGQKTVRLES